MNKRLLIDSAAVDRARLINQADYEDKRCCYLLDGGIVVCRNGLTLTSLRNQGGDAAVGKETAQIGFAAEADVGKERAKVTVFRVLPGAEAEQTLSAVFRAYGAADFRT